MIYLDNASTTFPKPPEVAETMARYLDLDAQDVNIKATTEEGLGFTGSGEGMAAHAVALLERIED